METLTISTQRTAKDAGQMITMEFADYLINGFKEKFPREKAVVFVAKETIMEAIENIENVSGIRFMYGYEAIDNGEARVLSRVLLLKPCRTSSEGSIPESIESSGYLTNTGAKVSTEKSRQITNNHTFRFSKYFPGLDFSKIMRGTFISINAVNELLEMDGCTGINFNFGYDPTISNAPERNIPVFEAVNSMGECLALYGLTPPCPVVCNLEDIFNVYNG